MALTDFPSLDGGTENWLASLKAGDATGLRKQLSCNKFDAHTLFRLGLASAERDMLAGVQVAYAGVGEQHPALQAAMASYWLEAAIMGQEWKVVYYLRALDIDPMREKVRQDDEFVGGAYFSRRTSHLSDCLHMVEDWSEEFVQQMKSSSLMADALFRAIHHHPYSCVSKLVEMGAPLNQPGSGYMPLWSALRAGKAPVIKLLLEYGAKIEMAGQHANKTLLVFAAEQGLEPCIWALVEGGASLLDHSCGMDAGQSARAAGRAELASRLETFGLKASPCATGSVSSRRL